MNSMSTPPVLSHAFRICFLLAAIWAALAVPLWLMTYAGMLTIADAYGGVAWHAHELIFGYAALVICGFLFTAIPNWTGRLPVAGFPLVSLILIWVLGRIAMLCAAKIGTTVAALVDLTFLAAVLAVAGREIIAGKNWRNLRVLVIVAWLFVANAAFHAAVLSGTMLDVSLRGAVGALVALITLIGGRLTPSFTRNWLVKRDPSRLPAPFGTLDAIAIGTGVVALLAWVIAPEGSITAGLAALAAFLLIVRLVRWRGILTFAEPLLAILHLGYAFVPLGFALAAGHALWPETIPAAAVIHAWTAGAVGVMTLAVMTRASLGHTGHALTAGPATTSVYLAILTAALLRVVAPFAAEWQHPLLNLSGAAWTLAFLLFVASYGPMLCTARKKKRAEAAA
jgi:uncharacterized protein involved in response to NO